MTDFPAVVYIKASRLDNSAPKLEDINELNVENPKKKIKVGKVFTIEKDNESLKVYNGAGTTLQWALEHFRGMVVGPEAS
ncbi:uncharacterized protein TNCT_76911 [Trichonephila clavata]|uniref:Uncharacterized protein n=1 Tax=Trichonephila clavata TaxID=2740835 RepID=A0A8X6HVB3_TRICU|nr:uncharacterized protein TNCT_76911 [Trichonephila clavata]